MAQWYYPGTGLGESDFADGHTITGWAPHQYMYGCAITLVDGTATYLSVKSDGPVGSIVRLGLYNSSRVLVSGAEGSISGTGGGYSWRDIAINVAVSAGTYYVMASYSVAEGEYSYDSQSVTGKGTTDDYAASMPSGPLTWDSESEVLFGVRVYVEAGGGSSTPLAANLSDSLIYN